MLLRDVLVGAVSTLIVTVLGGVAVFYATKEPDDKKAERLVYSINQSALFSGGAQDLAFSSVSVQNVGGVAAKHLTVRIGLSSAELRDLSIGSGSGLKELKRDRTAKELVVVYESLLPSEAVTFNLLLTKSERPAIDIRSDASLAQESMNLKGEPVTTKSKVNSVVEKAVPATGLLTMAVLSMFAFYFKRKGLFSPLNSQNNAGFLLLHHGLIEDAESTLRTAIRQGDFQQLTLSNYALCKGLRGDFDQANSLIRAASFREGSKHDRAVVLFNDGLIHLLGGDKVAARESLAKAIELSPKEVRRYCQRSVHLDVVRTEPAFNNLFKDD